MLGWVTGVALSVSRAPTAVSMLSSMRVVSTAVHLGACRAEDVNPGAPSTTLMVRRSECLSARTGHSQRSFFLLALPPRLKFDQIALFARRRKCKAPFTAPNSRMLRGEPS